MQRKTAATVPLTTTQCNTRCGQKTNMTASLMIMPHPLDDRYEYLTVSILSEMPHVTIVSLSRPRKRNAINAKVCPGLKGDVATSFSPENPNLFSFVVMRCGKKSGMPFACWGHREMDAIAFCSRGSGKAFSAGIDTSDPTFFPLQQDDVLSFATR